MWRRAWNTMRKNPSALLAGLLCPCHLMLLVVLAAGFAPGSWLAANQIWILAVGGLVFFVLVLWMWRQSPRDRAGNGGCSCAGDAQDA